jgi:purine-cytosine permease-like protein
VFAQPAPHDVGAAVGITTVLGAFASITGLNPLEVPDYARFMRHRTFRRDSFIAVVMPFIIIFFIATPLGIYFTLVMGEINPGVYFLTILGTGVGIALVWLSQIRVNVTSLHLGSLALRGISGLFKGGERLNRRFWLIIMVGLMIVLMVFNVIGNLTAFLQWDGILLLSWTGCLVADLVIVRKLLKIVSGPIEYRDEKLYRYNPVGLTAAVLATIAGSLLWVFSPGPVVHGLSGYIAFFIAIVIHTAMAVATRGRYYFRDAGDARLASGQS